MKRIIATSADSGQGANLYVKYLSGLDQNEVSLRSVTVRRPSLREALYVMLDHMDVDIDYEGMSELSDQEVIDEIAYINGESSFFDYILYLEDKNTGEIYIDNTYPEENY